MPRSPLADEPGYSDLMARLRNERLAIAGEREWVEPFEAAHLTDVTSSAITRAIRKGHLPARRSGIRGWLISRSDLDEYDRNRQRGRASPWYGSAGRP